MALGERRRWVQPPVTDAGRKEGRGERGPMSTNDHAGGRAEASAKEQAARYRRAAEETLDQLDWCVNYLYRIRKPGIAQAIARNRSTIRRRIRRDED